MESELREEKSRLLNVIKTKEGELTKERKELTDRLQQHEQVIEVLSLGVCLVENQTSCTVVGIAFAKLLCVLLGESDFPVSVGNARSVRFLAPI